MGGGGGGSYRNWKSDTLADAVLKDAESSAAEYETALAGYFSGLLTEFNDRDVELVHRRLDDAKSALQTELEGSFDQVFGGSVAKHTYVDGLSDIDSLLIINGSKLEEQTPETILDGIVATLRDNLEEAIEITHGRIAVTVKYPDGMIIQLLPAVRTATALKIPAARLDQWSNINPEKFRAALVNTNEACGGKLVPTIKLAKAIIGNLPEKYRLSGYHVESLALSAFQAYKGEKTTTSMLPHFFDRARVLILRTIDDPSGQSTHVDDYMGADNSTLRQEVSHVLGGITKRMRTASSSRSTAQWEALFYTE